METLKALHYGIEKDVVEALTLEVSVAARDHLGGTAPAQVNAAVARGRARLAG